MRRPFGRGLLVFAAIAVLASCLSAAYAGLDQYIVQKTMYRGKELVRIIVPGRPPDYRMPAVANPMPDRSRGINTLSSVPAFDWVYGCSATSAAMMAGYFDNHGWTNMYAGPANGGVCPLTNATWGVGESPLSATHMGFDGRGTRGHVDDYWIAYGNSANDPYITNSWTEHTWGDCTGDYMGTNQSKFGNSDGSTTFFFWTNGDPLYDFTAAEPGNKDGCHGMRAFAESRGYTVTTNFTQLIYPNPIYTSITHGYTFSDYMADIDAGRPVLIQVEGHTMLGYGYDTTGSVVYLHDTWDYANHTMTWGGSYSTMAHYGVSVLRLATGSLQVNLSPPDAVTAGAQWAVDGGGWQASGATVSGLAPGSHAVTYKAVSGWDAPAGESPTVTAGSTTTLDRAYTQQTGSLKVTINPPEVRSGRIPAHAQWRVDGGAWNDSGATVTGLTVGGHTVNYSAVPGYSTPPDAPATIVKDTLTEVTGTYTQDTGSLKVTLEPPEVRGARAKVHAQWRVDSGAWNDSGATVAGLTVGGHTVNYSAMPGYSTPPDAPATIVKDTLTEITGTYTATTTINPPRNFAVSDVAGDWGTQLNATWDGSLDDAAITGYTLQYAEDATPATILGTLTIPAVGDPNHAYSQLVTGLDSCSPRGRCPTSLPPRSPT